MAFYDRDNKWGSTDTTLRRIALTVQDPSSRDAYYKSCHAVTSAAIRERGHELPDDARIILLGDQTSKKHTVAHSIIVSRDDEIISDSLARTGAEKVTPAFETATGTYSHPAYDQIPMFRSFSVMADISIADFRERFLNAGTEPMPGQ